MKIICDNCRTKYSIADEKVQGKVFKIRCKKCGNIIVVRGNQSGAEASGQSGPEEEEAPAAVAAPESRDAPVWHLVVGREQVGPMGPLEVRDRFARGEIDAESYIWREGFSDWQRLTSVPEFADLAQSTSVVPASGVSGAPAAWSAGESAAPAADQWSAREPDPAAVAAAAAPAPGAWDAPQGPEKAWQATTDDQSSESANLFGGSLGGGEPGRDLFASQHGHDGGLGDLGLPGGGGLSAAAPAASEGLFRQAPAPAAAESQDPFGGNGGGQQVFPADDRQGGSPQMTGQRHENSVLFSLANLQALAMGGKTAAPSAPSSSGDGGSTGSGLIDIRSMAVPVSSGRGSVGDDLPDIGGSFAPSIAVAPVLLPSVSDEKPKWLVPAIAGGGVVFLGLVGLVLFLALRKPEPQIVAMAPTPPAAAPAAAPSAAPAAAPERKAVETKTEAKAEEGSAEAKKDGDTKAAGRRGGKKRGGKKGGVQLASAAEPADEPAGGGSARPGKKASGGGGRGGDELDALIDGAISGGGKKPARKAAAAAAPAADSNLPDKLSHPDIVAGMRKVKDRVQGCYDKFRVPGTAFTTVTIGQDGHIKSARVKGMFAGTPTGACLQAAVKMATFPRFKGAPITIDYPFILR